MGNAADRAVVDYVAGEDALDLVELVEHLLEPQLIGLVDDDEEHLVMGRLPAPGALALLAGQERAELEIVAVVDRGTVFRHGMTLGMATAPI